MTWNVFLNVEKSYENEWTNTVQFSKHSCEQCGKIFTRVGTLSRHKKTVHGGVKYSCNHCDREYTQSGDLAKHLKTKHSTTTDTSYRTYQLNNSRCDNL